MQSRGGQLAAGMVAAAPALAGVPSPHLSAPSPLAQHGIMTAPFNHRHSVSPYRHVHRTDGGGTLSGEKKQPIKIDFQPKILSPSTYQIFPIKIIASKSPYRCSICQIDPIKIAYQTHPIKCVNVNYVCRYTQANSHEFFYFLSVFPVGPMDMAVLYTLSVRSKKRK